MPGSGGRERLRTEFKRAADRRHVEAVEGPPDARILLAVDELQRLAKTVNDVTEDLIAAYDATLESDVKGSMRQTLLNQIGIVRSFSDATDFVTFYVASLGPG